MKSYEIVSLILRTMAEMAKPGVSLIEIDKKAGELMGQYDVLSYNKNYRPIFAKYPFPANSCISVNNVISHGIPIDYKLIEGDIVSFDIGIKGPDKQCGDAALTVGVGNISNKDERLIYYAKKTLYHAISMMAPGVNTRDIAYEIEHFVASRGYKVNRRFAGHRIGSEMHLKPNIYNTTENTHTYGELKAGEIYCIEPMLTYGRDDMGIVAPDGWTTYTSDGKNSAFFEHMVKITESGCEVLTDHITM